jgi:Transposase IS4
MHEAERKTPAYPKLAFAWAEPTYNFTNEKAEYSRGLFGYYIPDSELETIAEYTNRNAELQFAAEAPLGITHYYGKHWQPTTTSELKIWLGILLYQGVHYTNQPIEDYWNVDTDAPVNKSLGKYMRVTRWQQIQRYLKVSDPITDLEFDMQGKDYWRKMDPLATRFRARCQSGFKGGTHFAIDEKLKKFTGKSQHTLQIDLKAAGKAYKKYSLTTSGGYLIDFRFTSKKCKIANIKMPAQKGLLKGKETN